MYIFIAGAVIMLASLSGKLFTYGVFRNVIQKNLKFLITFALGVFVATTSLLIGEMSETMLPTMHIILVAALGAFTLEILQRLLPDAHHHHGTDPSECCDTHECQASHAHDEVHPESKINPKRILLGDAMHNIADGILLVPAYLISIPTGIVLTVGILLHEFVQETSEFFILKEAGYSTKRALISNFIVSSTIFIGIIISVMVSTASSYSPLLVAFSIGALLYIILRDLLPHTIERVRHSGSALSHVIVFVIGITIIISVAHLMPHA